MKWAVKHKLVSYGKLEGVDPEINGKWTYSIDNPKEGIDIHYCPWCSKELYWPWGNTPW